jgi:hypothetical protein
LILHGLAQTARSVCHACLSHEELHTLHAHQVDALVRQTLGRDPGKALSLEQFAQLLASGDSELELYDARTLLPSPHVENGAADDRTAGGFAPSALCPTTICCTLCWTRRS